MKALEPLVTERRLLLAAVLLSTWLTLLLVGQSWGGLVHLLLVAFLGAMPWRRVKRGLKAPVDGAKASPPSDSVAHDVGAAVVAATNDAPRAVRADE